MTDRIRARRSLTPLGVEIKKKLLDMDMTQTEFCKEYNIPLNRFSELLTGWQANSKYKKKVCKILKLDDIA